MTPEQRAKLVRQARLEIKQRRSEAEVRNETERQRAAAGWLRAVDRRRPRLRRDEDRAAFQSRIRSYEQDIGRRGGFAVGERLREMRESGGFGVDSTSPIAQRMIRRSNVRIAQQTRYHQGVMLRPTDRNWTERTLTPGERVNVIGVRSRRRTRGSGDIDGALAEARARNTRRPWF